MINFNFCFYVFLNLSCSFLTFKQGISVLESQIITSLIVTESFFIELYSLSSREEKERQSSNLHLFSPIIFKYFDMIPRCLLKQFWTKKYNSRSNPWNHNNQVTKMNCPGPLIFLQKKGKVCLDQFNIKIIHWDCNF